VVVSLKKTETTPPKSTKAEIPAVDSSPTKTAPFDEAVLMIVGFNSKGSAVSQGSGFIINSGGLAGSNYHVFQGVTQAIAECCGGRRFEIHSMEGADLNKDLVVFQLYELASSQKPQNLPHVTFASTLYLKVGQRVIAVGSPQGFENTVSDGILSAVREYDSVRYLQITAPISSGSSGGPILDSDGHMIGVATFQFERGQNLNFAVAANYIQPLLDQHFQVSIKEFQALVRLAKRRESDATTSSIGNTRDVTTSSIGNTAENSSLARLPEEYLFACYEADTNQCSKTVTHLTYQTERNILMEREDFQDYYLDADKKVKPSNGHWYASCPLHSGKDGHWIGMCTYSLLWKDPGQPTELSCRFNASEEITEITRDGLVSGVSGEIDWKPRYDPINPQCPKDSGKKKEFHLVPKQ
jgi:hypothetical protein